MQRLARLIASGVLVAGVAMPALNGTPLMAQYGRGDYYRGYRSQQPYDDRYDRDRYRGDYDRRYDDHHGGIGPGKGALIGGGAGALLGGLLGGGLKGALIGGGLGAGGGALLGKVNADKRHRDEYRDYRDYGDYRDGYRRY